MIGFLPYTLVSVIILIKRRQFEQVKAAVPVILGVLKSMSLEADEEGKDTEDLFHKAIALADSIQAVCKLLVCDIPVFCILFSWDYPNCSLLHRNRKIRKNSVLCWACLSCKSGSVFLRLNAKSSLSSSGSCLRPL